MDDSDDYGISDDDSAFLAVATQIEKQNDSFAESPRPTKQRRVAVNDEIEEVSWPHTWTANRYDSSSTNNQRNGNTNTRQTTLFKKPAKPKQRVLVPLQQERLPTLILTQTQVGLDDDPTAIRGPIWKKSRIEQDTMQSDIPPTTSSSTGRMLPPQKQLQKPSSTTIKPLGLNGNLHNMQRTASVSNRQVIAVDDFEDFSLDIDEADFDNMTKARPTALQAPKSGLKQMTIFGQAATQPLTASQAATKKHAWPLKEREEPKTHHLLDEKALETYTYPTNLGSVRDYQFNIVARSLFHNTLVALPTGLGKTFIAATIMLNYYRWMKEAQIIFMAPTKPLIAQQLEACYGIAGIPRHDTILMTGETTPTIRTEEWKERRVFFMTPQTVINDLKYGRCDPKHIVLLVVDEAHKATGGYAYTEVVAFIRRFNPSFRVLALTATPGSTVEAVQNVIDNLGIARVELRTEDSIDIRQYTHEKQTETELFDWNEEQTIIMDLISNAIRPVLEKLNSQNAYWTKEPMQLTPFGLQVARQKWSQSDAGRKASMGVKGMVNSIFTVLASLAHSLNLLKFHGILPFYHGMQSFQAELAEDQAKRKYARQIAESADFMKSMSYMRSWSSSLDFIGHPKLEYLRQVVMDHFVEAGEGLPNTTPRRATRIMIFSSFRDSTDEICRALKRNEPIVRPHVFVGQSASKNSEGMNQKKQNEIIQDFKNGKYNTLVATSIGEEGLDIGDVDLIICYDASASPIRMLQRIGRTGRKRVGRVVLLLMKGKEERDYAKAQDNYAFIQHSIAQTDKYTYRDDQSLRIIPKDVSPVVDKRVVEIPAENTQPVDLNEKSRRKAGKSKAKKPAKKFFMPDGVQTGFVKASRIGDDDSDEESEKPAKKARKAGPSKATSSKKKVVAPSLPDVASIPFLEDVLLKPEQARDHERRYARTSDLADDTIISPPAPDEHPDYLRRVQQGVHVRNSRATISIQQSLKDVHDFDYSKIEKWEDLGTDADLCIDDGFDERLAEPLSTNPLAIDTSATKQKKMLVGKKKKAPAKSSKTSKATNSKKTARSSNINAYGSDAMEHDESEPEPTPQHLRIATQGIDLGSDDTSGEDEEEEYDSELDRFVVGSDQPIETLSSSQPGTQYIVNQSSRGPSATQRARELEGIFTSDAEAEDRDGGVDRYVDDDSETLRVDDDVDEIDDDEPIIRGKKKRRVLDSDSDSE